jgi:hypothetical protein
MPIADMRQVVSCTDDRLHHSGDRYTFGNQPLRPAAVASEMGQ